MRTVMKETIFPKRGGKTYYARAQNGCCYDQGGGISHEDTHH